MKLLTIVIPMYNTERYIDQCLTSLIIDEGMEQMEVLVVNDGSRDRSSEIAHGYEARYPQTFRVIDKENGNYGSCINRALREATGKYIRILDADDFYETKNLTSFLRFLASVDLDMVFTRFRRTNDDGRKRKRTRILHRPGKTYGVRDLYHPRLHITMHCVTYRTELLRRIGYTQTEGISYTDHEWVFWPMSMIKTWQYYPHVIYNYRLGREGQTVNPEVLVRSMPQAIEGFLITVRQYERMKSELDTDRREYLLRRLVERAKFEYKPFLLRHHKLLRDRMDELVTLDKTLAEISPDTYQAITRIRVHLLWFPYYYVRRWRESGYNDNLLGLRLKRK